LIRRERKRISILIGNRDLERGIPLIFLEKVQPKKGKLFPPVSSIAKANQMDGGTRLVYTVRIWNKRKGEFFNERKMYMYLPA